MKNIFDILGHFGALAIPVLYLLCTRFRGSASRAMLFGIGLQFVLSLAVLAYVYFSWRAGSRDWWMGWTWLPLANVASFFYFVNVLFFYGFPAKSGK